MKAITLLLLVLCYGIFARTHLRSRDYTEVLKLLNDTMTSSNQFQNASFDRLAYVVDSFGPRLWGSDNLELALKYMRDAMIEEGFENVRLEPVPNITHWVRGEEKLTLFDPRPSPTKIPMVGLGQSVGGNVTGEVIVFKTFDEMEANKDKIKGKIVLFNMEWVSYGKTVAYRSSGASRVSKYGAIGCIIRSVTPVSIASPHTGSMYYDSRYPRIPAAAISVEDAAMFERMYKRGQKIVVNLYMEAQFLPNTNSNNVVGELVGSTYPDEIVLMGGHIDSWDVGPQTGANDDGAGFMVCFEAVRLLTKLGLRPKRTLRFIAWSGEEFGSDASGSMAYMRAHKNEMEKHVLGFESDLGAQFPTGFGFTGGEKAYSILKMLSDTYMKDFNSTMQFGGGDNADVDPLYQNYKVPMMAPIIQDTSDHKFYFTYHHSAGDSMNILNPKEMDRNVLLIASMMYLIADLPTPLPKE